MRNEVRNSIVLATLLVLIFIMKLILSAGPAKQIKQETALLEKNKTELASLQYVIIDTMQVYFVKQKIAKMDDWQREHGKTFVNSDNSRKTWSYLSSIINTYCPELELSFETSGDDEDDMVNHNYRISGTTDIQSLYNFLNHIENQKQLYVISEPRFSANTHYEEDGSRITLVSFDMALQSIVNATGPEQNDQSFRRIKSEQARNFFEPKIYSPYANPNEVNKLNAEKFELLSLSASSAFIKAENGQVYRIKPGHQVAYGFLKSINWQKQSITFSLNKIGIYKDYTIALSKE